MAGMRCRAKTLHHGEHCNAWAGASGYCFAHDPGMAEQRAAARKKGGFNRKTPSGGDMSSLPAKVRTMEDVLSVLDFTLSELKQSENSVARARCLVSLAGEFRQCIEVGELEQRIQRLEESQNGRITATR